MTGTDEPRGPGTQLLLWIAHHSDARCAAQQPNNPLRREDPMTLWRRGIPVPAPGLHGQPEVIRPGPRGALEAIRSPAAEGAIQGGGLIPPTFGCLSNPDRDAEPRLGPPRPSQADRGAGQPSHPPQKAVWRSAGVVRRHPRLDVRRWRRHRLPSSPRPGAGTSAYPLAKLMTTTFVSLPHSKGSVTDHCYLQPAGNSHRRHHS